jgi:hypothetical protein
VVTAAVHDDDRDHCVEWIDPVKALYDRCFTKAWLLAVRFTP